MPTIGGGDAAASLFAASRPRSPLAHWLPTGDGGLLLLVDGTQLFDVDSAMLVAFDRASAEGAVSIDRLLSDLQLRAAPLIDGTPLSSPPLHALSLAVAQKCNMGCSYCYAAQGEFGGAAKAMQRETAHAAVELLFRDAAPGACVNLSFLGGEPLTNREVLRSSTALAARLASARGVTVTFSITTNGTLLSEDDGAFFEEHGFAVTVSLDGLREAHDRHRVFKGGGGTFDRIMDRVRPLLAIQRRMQVSVRSTVTPGHLHLRAALDFFLTQGFHSVGFSPVLHASGGSDELRSDELRRLLDAMVECGEEFERHVVRGERYAFANAVNAMRELHRGTHRPYPCGAGAGYMGVSAEGELAACHRFVGDASAGMGDVASGIDRERQNRWLAVRHVDRQEPCQACWARYMCGGGCHHEVIARGRPACDYIRGWLHYCLGAYGRLRRTAPHWFGNTVTALDA
jgi:uncharacterized protein